jgi:hypothetical protein
MSKNILGVKPAIPDCKEIEIIPFVSENINWAKGRVPLVQGNSIGISWKKVNNLEYIYKLEIPDDYKAFMVVSKDWTKRCFKINNKSFPKGTNRVQLISGTYEIEFRK